MPSDISDILIARIITALPAIGAGFGLILASLAMAAFARGTLRRIAARSGPDRMDMIGLGATVAFWSVLIFGLVSGLDTMGLNVGALIAGLGLTGFALGFALRDAVSNLLAGVLILSYRPFRRGDPIKVAGFEGRVMGVDLRYTTLESEDARILIPNQTLFTNAVIIPRRPPSTLPPAGGAGS